MAVVRYASGTKLADGTEQLLTAVNVVGTFTLHVDTVNMGGGDKLQLRVYQTVLTGGTPRVAFEAEFDDAQSGDDLIKISVPISNDLLDTNSLKFTLKQTAGVNRNYDWKVIRHF